MRVEVKEQEPSKRINNFKEVCQGYNQEEMIEEAKRCSLCTDAMCVQACPLGINIPGFIKELQSNNPDNALKIIQEKSCFPGVCGRLCAHERLCEGGCIFITENKEIAIGLLERYAADHGHTVQKKIKYSKKKVAIVGAGPCGLTCAHDLNDLGYQVTVFEADAIGGFLSSGMPEFKVPSQVIEDEIKYIQAKGVTIKPHHLIGKTLIMDDLTDEFDAVFISTGAGLPKIIKIPGQDLLNIYSAGDYLNKIRLQGNRINKNDPVNKAEKTVVLGCSCAAIYAARTARRLGSDVTVIYRRSIIEATARQKDIKYAQEEGIHFMFLTNIKKILGKSKVNGVQIIQMMLSEKEQDGRKLSVEIENSEYNLECDQVILAVGQDPHPLISRSTDLVTDDVGRIMVDDKFRTNIPKVFAGGAAIGVDRVISAISQGKKGAEAIDEFLKE